MTTTIRQYVANLEAACATNTYNLFFTENAYYGGKEGLLKMGREIGYAFAGYTDQDVAAIMAELYSRLVVRFHFGTRGGVPLDAKDFYDAIRAGRANELERMWQRSHAEDNLFKGV